MAFSEKNVGGPDPAFSPPKAVVLGLETGSVPAQRTSEASKSGMEIEASEKI